MVPSCAEGGVLGVLPGVVGVIQAIEAIKLICGIGDPLMGRLLHFDALKMKFKEFKLRKDPKCPVCSENPSITELVDYDQFCGIPQAKAAEEEEAHVPTITATELKAKRDRQESFVLLDVREPFEWDICRIEGAKLIPLGQLPSRMSELDSADEIVLQCKSGVRSARALRLLQEAGFGKLSNLEGGILAWSDQVDSSIPKY
jgi:adenylyltransferase/sulfurtransferase